MRGSAWECMGVHGSAWECVGVRGSAWECVGVRGSAWGRMVARGSAWECVPGVSIHAHMYCLCVNGTVPWKRVLCEEPTQGDQLWGGRGVEQLRLLLRSRSCTGTTHSAVQSVGRGTWSEGITTVAGGRCAVSRQVRPHYHIAQSPHPHPPLEQPHAVAAYTHTPLFQAAPL